MLVFERTIRYIYQSQFRLLKHLKNTPINLAFLYYSQFINSGGNINYEIHAYLNWLEKFSGFIKSSKKDDSYIFELTDRGKRFIDYCDSMGYSENEFLPF